MNFSFLCILALDISILFNPMLLLFSFVTGLSTHIFFLEVRIMKFCIHLCRVFRAFGDKDNCFDNRYCMIGRNICTKSRQNSKISKSKHQRQNYSNTRYVTNKAATTNQTFYFLQFNP